MHLNEWLKFYHDYHSMVVWDSLEVQAMQVACDTLVKMLQRALGLETIFDIQIICCICYNKINVTDVTFTTICECYNDV